MLYSFCMLTRAVSVVMGTEADEHTIVLLYCHFAIRLCHDNLYNHLTYFPSKLYMCSQASLHKSHLHPCNNHDNLPHNP